MRPLQAVAMGVLVLVLVASASGYDLLADPLGWLLVLVGVRRLPDDVPLLPLAAGLVIVAGVVSVALWLPSVVEAVADAGPAAGWAANLPRYVALAALALALAGAAGRAGEPTARAWWRLAAAGCGVVALLPIAVLGAAVGLRDAVGTAAVVVPVLLVVLGFAHSGAAWAGGGHPGVDAQRPPAGRTGGDR